MFGRNTHAVLTSATPETRMRIARVLLDYMRRELAIKVTISIRDHKKVYGSLAVND